MLRPLLLPLAALLLTAGCLTLADETVVATAAPATMPRGPVEARIVGLRAELDRAVQRAIAE